MRDADTAVTRTLRAEDVDSQVELALSPAVRGGWRGSSAAAHAVGEIADWGVTLLDGGEVDNAIVVFAALSAGVRSRYEELDDEESEIGRVLDECVDGLERCLDRALGEVRQGALDVLLDLAIWDAASGGYGVGGRSREVVIERATKPERHRLAARAEPALATVSSSYSRQELGALIVRLRGDAAGDAEQLAALRDGGHPRELLSVLLQRHDVREARDALARIESWSELVDAADLFVDHGYVDQAEAVLAEVVEARRSTGRREALDWLARHAAPKRVHLPASTPVGWVEELFWEEPSVENWMRLRAASKESRRVRLRHRLASEGRHLLLVEILVAENKHREALTKFARVAERDERALRAAEKIADGVAAKKPRAAAALYAEAADAHCERASPARDELAVELVVRGRAALLAAGHTTLAERYVADFRERHAHRRALIDRLAARTSCA